MKREQYKKIVSLLLDILPYALQDKRVALKGGTAINLFHRNLPRFSIDIDLCYLPLEDRAVTFNNLHAILAEIKRALEDKLQLHVSVSNPLDGKKESKLLVAQGEIEVKIEPNFILRSSLFQVEHIELAPMAVNEFSKNISARCLSMADTYGGKICAALDRQHPRDLFDVKFLLDADGITTDIKDSFIFYLISHNRPIDELLNPNFKDISDQFESEFSEMTLNQVSFEELLKYREALISAVQKALTPDDKKFLLSFVDNRPDWNLVRDSKIKDYPSVKWKLLNQAKMEESKRQIYLDKVSKLFEEI